MRPGGRVSRQRAAAPAARPPASDANVQSRRIGSGRRAWASNAALHARASSGSGRARERAQARPRTARARRRPSTLQRPVLGRIDVDHVPARRPRPAAAPPASRRRGDSTTADSRVKRTGRLRDRRLPHSPFCRRTVEKKVWSRLQSQLTTALLELGEHLVHLRRRSRLRRDPALLTERMTSPGCTCRARRGDASTSTPALTSGFLALLRRQVGEHEPHAVGLRFLLRRRGPRCPLRCRAPPFISRRSPRCRAARRHARP